MYKLNKFRGIWVRPFVRFMSLGNKAGYNQKCSSEIHTSVTLANRENAPICEM